MFEAAKKEGKVVWYTSVDLPLAERISKSFEAKFPGVACRVERTGAERVFQRIDQEYGSNIYAVDVVNSSDAAHLIVWKSKGWLAGFVPEDVARHYPAGIRILMGRSQVSACFFARWATPDLVKAEDAPKSYADVLDPKWIGKIVKAHPSYGTILTATYQVSRDIGWDYFEKLAKEKVCRCNRRPIRPRS